MPELSEEIKEAEKLKGLLEAIERTYEDLPDIDFSDEIVLAERLLLLLQAIGREAENLPDLPEVTG